MADELTCAEAVRRMGADGWLEMPLAHDRSIQVGRYGESGDRREVDIFEFGNLGGDCWLTPDQARVLASALLGVDVEAMQNVCRYAVTMRHAARAVEDAMDEPDMPESAFDTLHGLLRRERAVLFEAVDDYLAGQEAGGGE